MDNGHEGDACGATHESDDDPFLEPIENAVEHNVPPRAPDPKPWLFAEYQWKQPLKAAASAITIQIDGGVKPEAL